MGKKRIDEDKKELEEYQKKQSELMEKQLEERLRKERKIPEGRKVAGLSSGKTSQLKLLAGAVKRKTDTAKDPAEVKKEKEEEKEKEEAGERLDCVSVTERQSSVGSAGSGGLLGLGDYGSDSDSDSEQASSNC